MRAARSRLRSRRVPSDDLVHGAAQVTTTLAFCGMVCRMRHRRSLFVSASFACSALIVASVVASAQQQALTPQSDTVAVERGQKLLVDQCGFCHGANARGGSGGPDLTRSALVQTDEDGR